MLINILNLSKSNFRQVVRNCLTICVLSSGVLLSACQSTPSSTAQTRATRVVLHPERPIQPAVPIQQLTPLQGTTWQIIEIKGRIASIHVERAWIEFSNQTNRLQGSTGCNRLWGDYSLAANNAIKMRGYNGQRNCEGALVQEANLLDAFDQTIAYRLDAAGLVLIDGNQNVVLRATATQPKR